MNTQRIVKYGVFGLLGIIGIYFIFMMYLVLTTDKCNLLDASVSSKNRQLTSLLKFYLNNVSPFSTGDVCFPGTADKRPLTVIVATCGTVKNYPLCEEITAQLLNHGADINANDPDREMGFTALHEAVYGADTHMVEFLLSRGAHTNAHSTGTKFFNKTPIELIPILRQTRPNDSLVLDKIEAKLQSKANK